MVRRVTAGLMVAVFLLTITWPFEFSGRKPHDPQAVRRAWAVRLLAHTGAIVVGLVGAGVGAALISRQAKREYRDASLRNLQALVEGEEEA